MGVVTEVKKWILIVDDETDFREMVRSYVEMNFGDHVKIIEAADGVEAANRLPFQAFDCIVTDLRMPRRGGAAFIQSVRESHLNLNTPVIVITGVKDDYDRDFSDVYLMEKPLDSAKFISLVESQLKLGRTDQRIAADLLNSFIDSGNKFLGKVLAENPQQQTPLPKKAGDEVQGEILRVISLKVGKTRNVFVIGFTEELVSLLAKKGGGKGKQDGPKVVSSASDIILKYAIKYLGESCISDIRTEYLSERVGSTFKKLKKNKGIIIPIKTSGGNLVIHALWGAIGETKKVA